jgi:RHS repeat-associated protein
MFNDRKQQERPQSSALPVDARVGEPTAARERSALLPSLTLPTGGGAIRGIGEKFSTNAATGTGSLDVPIATSKGRAGFELGLRLSYDSGAGNGPFGLGWRLSTPSVTRKTDRGLPRYVDGAASDVFVLSGAEDLVPVPFVDPTGVETSSGGGTENGITYRIDRYRPRTEGLFARVERWTALDGEDAHWRVITRDNVLNIYGRSPGGRVVDPEHPKRAFSWLLEETRDDRGNVVRYSYKQEDGAGVNASTLSESHRFEPASMGTPTFRASAQRYLKRIYYGNVAPVMDRTKPLSADPTDYLFEVVFDYGDHDSAMPTPEEAQPWPVRPDPFSTYRAAFEVRTYRRCWRVLMFHRIAELASTPCLVRSTDFTFDESLVLSEDGTYADGPVATYLVAATQAGYVRLSDDMYERAALPPLVLGYTRPVVHAEVQHVDRDSLDGIWSGVGTASAQWVDLDGEGIPGVLLSRDSAWYYKENLGSAHLTAPFLLRSLPAPAELRGGAQRLTDIGGDGNLDLVRYSPPLAGYFERTPEGGWAPFVALQALPKIDWADQNLRFLDLDGDGFPDVLITEHDAFVWYRSRAKDGFEPAAFVKKPKDERMGPAVIFADGSETVSLADMTGDGMVDIVRVRNGDVCYWPNLGYGRFGRRVTLDRSPRFDASDQFDPKRIRFADLDGSGTNDLIYLGRDGVRLYFNQSGNGLTAPLLVRSFGPVDSATSVAVVDLLGRGTPCLVWSSPLPANRPRPVAYIDLMGGLKPHMLSSVVNNMGAETRITFAPSTQFYLADKAARKPWLTRLAFPVQVVERIEHYDHVAKSKLVTRFSYHHGYFDGYEREFRGFARVEQWDAESFGEQTAAPSNPSFNAEPELVLPPVRTVTWFHTGAWLERERLERALSREYYGGAWLDEPPVSGVWRDYFGRDARSQDQRAAEFFLPDTVFELDSRGTGVPDQLSVGDQREAVRALRGQILRQEIYAEDGTDAADHPYSVSQRNYQVRRIQPIDGDAHGVFFSHPLNALSLHYERGYRDPSTLAWTNDDPRISHELVLKVDLYGSVVRSAAVGYPRRAERRTSEEAGSNRSLAEQSRLWVTLTERSFADRPNATDWYRIGVPAEVKTNELTGLVVPAVGAFTAADITASFAASTEIPYEAVATVGIERRVVECQRSFYYDDYPDLANFQRADTPLPLGEITPRALPHQMYRQALTQGLVTQVYGANVSATVLENEGSLVPQDGSWWAPSGRGVPDPARFYLTAEVIDAFRQPHSIEYDTHALLVIATTDPVGNRVTVQFQGADGTTENGNDYRVLAPRVICDPNQNRTQVTSDALGKVLEIFQMSSDGTDGDTDVLPGVVFQYDLLAFQTSGQPVYAHTAKREVHRAGGDPFQLDGTPTRLGWQHSRVYSDGAGREAMKKVQAEPGPVPVLDADGRLALDPSGAPETQNEINRWTGTGRTVFDNKGNPVKKYEPFFSGNVDYEDDEVLVQWGVSPILRYDALGRLVRIDHPNQTISRVVFDPWTQEAWDENDTVLESQWYVARGSPDPQGPVPSDDDERSAWLAAKHAKTPTVTHLDPLARAFLTIADNGVDSANNARNYPTRLGLDIEGNQLLLTDARGVVTLAQVFDVLGRKIQTTRTDAGQSSTLFDATNKPIRAWDPRGYTVRYTHDALQRRTHVFVQLAGDAETLCERVVYGETHPEAEARNLRARVYQTYDGAGAFTTARYEFKGNSAETSRRLALAYHVSPDWMALVSLGTTSDIEAAANASLEAETFTTSVMFDALSRVVSRTTPDGSATGPTYNQAGLLETVDVAIRAAAATTFVENIDYNARGQRLFIQYANGTRTAYEYDRDTFRLVHLLTTGAEGAALQDMTYTYDPVGDIVAIRDGVSYGNAAVPADGRYEYDAVYQLVRAEGREHPGQQPASDDPAQLGIPLGAHPNDWQALSRYVETYNYDPVGNILQISHRSVALGGADGWTRRYGYASDSNQLLATSTPGDAGGTLSAKYQHDAAGNMQMMPHLSMVDWDYANRLQHTKNQAQNGNASLNDVYCAYDPTGQRVRKVYEHGGLVEENIYLGGYETYRKMLAGQVVVERQTLHVMDDKTRVALVETKSVDATMPAFTASTRKRFQIESHVGSSVLEIDEAGSVISYEEYYPYGSTAFRAADSSVDVSAKRYRYTGKERDDETGFYYHGARYYAAWLARWIAVDPAEEASGNLYEYVANSPATRRDPTGFSSELPSIDQAISRHGEVARQRYSRYLDAATEAGAPPVAAGTLADRAMKMDYEAVYAGTMRDHPHGPAGGARTDTDVFLSGTRLEQEFKKSLDAVRPGQSSNGIKSAQHHGNTLQTVTNDSVVVDHVGRPLSAREAATLNQITEALEKQPMLNVQKAWAVQAKGGAGVMARTDAALRGAKDIEARPSQPIGVSGSGAGELAEGQGRLGTGLRKLGGLAGIAEKLSIATQVIDVALSLWAGTMRLPDGSTWVLSPERAVKSGAIPEGQVYRDFAAQRDAIIYQRKVFYVGPDPKTSL